MQRFKLAKQAHNSTTRTIRDTDNNVAATFTKSPDGDFAYNLFMTALAKAGGTLTNYDGQVLVGVRAELEADLPSR